MENKRIGKQTVNLDTSVYINSTYSIVGPKESEGPLAKYFDNSVQDAFFRRAVMGKGRKQTL